MVATSTSWLVERERVSKTWYFTNAWRCYYYFCCETPPPIILMQIIEAPSALGE